MCMFKNLRSIEFVHGKSLHVQRMSLREVRKCLSEKDVCAVRGLSNLYKSSIIT
jgi:hypothetical protein